MSTKIRIFWRTHYSGKSRIGISSLELSITALVLITISIFSVDAIALVFGADFCDRTCKDCARAAGQMSTPDDAVNAMNAVAAAHPVDGVLITKMYPELLLYQDDNNGEAVSTPGYGTTAAYLAKNGPSNITPAMHEEDEVDTSDPEQTKSPGPHVQVRTTLFMHIPVPLTIFGTKLFSGNVDGNPQLVRFQSRYTFPITNTYVPN